MTGVTTALGMRSVASPSSVWKFMVTSVIDQRNSRSRRAERLGRFVVTWLALMTPMNVAWAQFFGPPLDFSQVEAPITATQSPDIKKSKPKPTLAPRPQRPRVVPIPPPRPWGEGDAVSVDEASSTARNNEPQSNSARFDAFAGGEKSARAAPSTVKSSDSTSRSDPEGLGSPPAVMSGTEPPSLSLSKLASSASSANIEKPPQLSGATRNEPVNETMAAVRKKGEAGSPDSSESEFRGLRFLHSAPTASAGRAGELRALLLVVRGGVGSASDLKGLRIASVSGDDEVWAALKSVVTDDFIAVASSPGSKVEGLQRGDVDAVVIGLGPPLPESDVAAAAVGQYRALQFTIPRARSSADTRSR